MPTRRSLRSVTAPLINWLDQNTTGIAAAADAVGPLAGYPGAHLFTALSATAANDGLAPSDEPADPAKRITRSLTPPTQGETT